MSPSAGEWRQPAHIPRIPYRSDPSRPSPQSPNNPPAGYISTEIPAARIQATQQQPQLHGRENASSPGPPKVHPAQTSTLSPQVQKRKKNPLFGGLFAKESSRAALEQVAAQLAAQYGDLSPRTVPGVSSQKLPDSVSYLHRVEAAKAREMQLKDRNRAAKRKSITSTAQGTQSIGSGERRYSGSTMSSFNSRGSAAENYQRKQSMQSASSMAASLGARSSGEAGPQQNPNPNPNPASECAQSGSNLPEITSFFPTDIPATPAVPKRYQSTASKTSKNS